MNGYHYNAAEDSRSGETTAQEDIYRHSSVPSLIDFASALGQR